MTKSSAAVAAGPLISKEIRVPQKASASAGEGPSTAKDRQSIGGKERRLDAAAATSAARRSESGVTAGSEPTTNASTRVARRRSKAWEKTTAAAEEIVMEGGRNIGNDDEKLHDSLDEDGVDGVAKRPVQLRKDSAMRASSSSASVRIDSY